MITTIQNSTPSDYTFSIIIPTWNNLEMLKLCLQSLREHSNYNHQYILHINDGSDGTLEWAKNNFSGDITYSEKNVGICYPLNYASRLVQSDYYCYFNDDMYALPNWDQPIYKAIKARKDKLFFYSATQIQPFEFWDNSIIADKNYGTEANNFKKEKLLKDYSSFHKEDWSGATWPPNVVHIDVWNQVGGYSIEYSPGMYSDPDFSMKLWQLGVRDFRGFGDSLVYHFESKSTKRVKKNKGSDQFLKKWGITSRTFGKHFLRRGEKYRGPIDHIPQKSNGYTLDKLRGKFKLISKLFL